MAKFYKLGFVFYFLFILNTSSNAQLTQADSVLFNTAFTNPLYIPYWNYPYKWYVYDSVTSAQKLTDRFNSTFPFMPSDFNSNTFKDIHTSNLTYATDINASFNTLPWIYNQTDPVMKLPFELHGKYDTAFTAFTPSAAVGNCKTAFLLIHGNDVNTTTQLLQGIGYACYYCNVKNTCLQYGDVYTYSKPNEDWRAIYWNKKKLNDYVYDYCEAIGQNYGTNYLIETIALVKSLKANYSKIIILGISEGGYTTLLNLLNTEPDGAVVSGGYSINFDTYFPSQFLLSNRFGNAPQVYKRDTVKAQIATKQTNILFTWGNNDNVDLMDPEHDFHYTQNFLNNNTNCSYFYNFNNHTFPPCYVLDTFIQRINAKPKAFIVPLDNVCNSDSMQIKIGCCGQSPFQFEVHKNGSYYATVNSNTDTILYTIYSEGSYQVKNIDDASIQTGINSNIYNYTPDSAIGFLATNKHFNCDSNLTEFDLILQGTAPWYLSSTLDNNPVEDTMYTNAVNKKYANTELNYLQIVDENGCALNLNQVFSIKDSLTDINIIAPVFDCDSNKTKITLDLKGRIPWNLQYKKNGVNANIIITNPYIELFFENGLYEFLEVTDSNQCQKVINQIFNFNFDSLSVAVGSPIYNCDSNKTTIQFDLQGDAPWIIDYTKDGLPFQLVTYNALMSLFFENGNYVFQSVTDANGCIKNINQNFNFSNSALNYSLATPIYDCDSNKTQIHFDLQGNAPWTINYTKDATPLQIITNTANIDLFFENGIYQFIQLSDASCFKNINQTFLFNSDSIDVVLSNPVYNCDSAKTEIQFDLQGDAPWIIEYTKDGLPFQLVTNNALMSLFFENGNYVFQSVTDANGCIKSINQNFNFSNSALNYSLATPIYDCDSNKTQIHFDLQGNAPWTINYTKDATPLQIITNTANIDLFFENGIYQFIQVSDASCFKSINQTFLFNNDSIDVVLSNPVYNCDSNKTAIQFDLQGSQPFVINYTKNALAQQIITSNVSHTQLFENGNYDFQSVTDASGCTKIINQNYIFNYDTINYLLSTPQYQCDSNKTKIHFDLQGNTPWIINYTMDGLSQQIISNNANFDIYFTNGTYQFIQVSDATNCIKNINQYFVFNNNSIGALLSSPAYDCDSSKTAIQFDLQGNAPFTINYTKDAIGQQLFSNISTIISYFSNGNYSFQNVSDGTGCLHQINQNFVFNNDSLNYVLSNPQYQCDSNKTLIHFDLQGNAPWVIDYTKDGLPQQIFANSANFDVYYTNGVYQFIKVTDASNCSKNMNQYFVFNYNPIGAVLSTPFYNCDSNKTMVQFDLQGNAPFTINYTKNAIAQQLTTNAAINSLYFENGNYDIQNVTDGAGCVQILNQNFAFNYDSINYVVSVPQYNCDSNKTHVHFNLQGNAPWVIDYTKDGLSQQIITNNASFDAYYSNGNYQFMEISDATNCAKVMNQFFAFNYDTISAILTAPSYNCDSNKTAIQFSLQGNMPFKINYTKDALAQQIITSNANYTTYFENGAYSILNVSDATNCTINVNQNYFFNFEPINYSMTVPQYSCDSNKTVIHFDLQGNAPWIIAYTKDGIPLQILTNSATFDQFFTNGTYQFIKVTDATNCSKNINQFFVFNYNSINAALSVPFYHCDSNKTAIQFNLQGNAPYLITYTMNAVAQQISTVDAIFTRYFENGSYVFQNVMDGTGCLKNINQNFVFNFDTIDYTIGVPQYNCDSNQTKIHFNLQGNMPWIIDYKKNGLPLQIFANSASFDLLYSNGLYQFIQVKDATNCIKNINQAYNFNYVQINAVISQQKYNCDSNKYQIDLQLQGNGPWIIFYNNGVQFLSKPTNNPAATLMLPNGNWTITKIKDATNCEFIFNYNVNVNFNPINVVTTAPVYDCDSNKIKVNFSLSGNAPWAIKYTLQTVPPAYYSIQTYNPSYKLYLSTGSYLITQIVDSTNCVFDLLQSVNNTFTPLSVQKNPDNYNCDSTKMRISYSFIGDGPYKITYKNNGNGLTYQLNSPGPNIDFYLGDGSYTVLSGSDIKCTKILNDTIIINYPKLNSTLNPAIISCDSAKVYVQFTTPQGNKPFTYYYYFNNQYLNFTTYNNSTTFYLSNGQYFFEKVADSMGCVVNFNQIVNANYTPYIYTGFTKKYICEKDSTELTFQISNSIKVYVAYTFNGGAVDSFEIAANNNKTFLVSNGSYELLYISDSVGCVQNINQTVVVDYVPVDVNYSISMMCAARKYSYQFDLKGNSPWTLHYNYKNIPRTAIINSSPFNWDVDAGIYYLSDVVDGNGCKFELQKADTLQEFIGDFPTLYYKDFALHTIRTPFKYYWYKDDKLIDSTTKVTIPSYGNGIYKVLIVDNLGCSNWSNEITLGYPANINVFPNPVRSSTHVVINDNFGQSWNYQLFDASGKLLQEKTQIIPSADIEMQQYSSGVYNLIVRFGNQPTKNVIRLIKQ